MAKRERRTAIRAFERLVYLGLAVGSVSTYLYFQEARISAWGELALIVGLTAAVNLLFVWLIAYRANNIMKWIFVVLVILGAVFFIIDLIITPQRLNLALALSAFAFLLPIIEILLLFSRDSRAWFAGERPVDPDIFD